VLLRKWDRIGQVRAAQGLYEQEPQSRRLSFDGARRELAIAEQMDLLLADMIRPELLRRTVKVLGELLDRMDVRPHGVRRVVTTLKLIEHQLAKMGHRGILLVTHTLNPAAARAATNAASAAPAA
jgi:hypothetical protein